jgi:hypothetical protein
VEIAPRSQRNDSIVAHHDLTPVNTDADEDDSEEHGRVRAELATLRAQLN